MHRINVNKSDEVTLVAERVIDAEGERVILNVPRFSRLAESATNFRLLKREAEALGKELLIETVDDKVIELCDKAGLECLNPFFSGENKKISDIVTESSRLKGNSSVHVSADQEVDSQVDGQNQNSGFMDQDISFAKTGGRSIRITRENSRISRSAKGVYRKKISTRKAAVIFFVILALLGGSFLAAVLLPRADVKITSAKTDKSYQGLFKTDLNLKTVDPGLKKIPGQVFSQRKNIQLFFAASGKRVVERKAKGKIIIYNAHSSDEQTLVATTRFQAPDGKIFRLNDKVLVPGAKIVSGKIEPSSIEVEVTADKPGEAYNIGSVAKFTIPGLSGTKKFDTFYGESKTAMTGGFIGEAAFPTKEDVEKAKAETGKKLEEATTVFILAQLPEEFKLLDGAKKFKILKEEVNTETDSEGKFSVSAEAEASASVFREKDVLELIEAEIKKDAGEDFETKESKLNYDSPSFDAAGALNFKVNYQATLTKKIDLDSLKAKIADKSESDLKGIILSISGIESAEVSLWPFWVRRVPEDLDKISVTVD